MGPGEAAPHILAQFHTPQGSLWRQIALVSSIIIPEEIKASLLLHSPATEQTDGSLSTLVSPACLELSSFTARNNVGPTRDSQYFLQCL